MHTLLCLLSALVTGCGFATVASAVSQVQATAGGNELRIDSLGRMSLYVGHDRLLSPVVVYEEFLLRKQDWAVVSCSGLAISRIEGGAEVTCRYGGVDVVRKRITLTPGELALHIDVNLPARRFPEIRRVFHQLRLADEIIRDAPYIARSGEEVVTGKMELSGMLRQGFLTNLRSLQIGTRAGRLEFTFDGQSNWNADDLSSGTLGRPYFRLRREGSPVAERYTLRISLPPGEGETGASDVIRVNPTQPLRPVNPRVLGMNVHAFYWGKLHTWQLDGQSPAIERLREAGIASLRYPGGDRADFWHWQRPLEGGEFGGPEAGEPCCTGNPDNVTDTDAFARFNWAMGAAPLIITNVATGSAAEAAEWVRYANVERGYGFPYWEVGNEEYITREPVKYAETFRQYASAMKAVDPGVLVGANVGPLATSWTTSPVAGEDLLTQWNHWLPEVVAGAGDQMDFFNVHYYPSKYLSYGALFESALGLGQELEGLRETISSLAGRSDARITVAEWGWQWPSFGRGIFAAIVVGELFRSGVDLACYYDYDGWADWGVFSQMFAGPYLWEPHTPEANPLRRPTYWAFYLWNRMKGELIETSENSPYAPVAVYAAKDAAAVRVLLINKSGWDKSVPLHVMGTAPSQEPKAWVLRSTPDRLGADGLDSVECTLNGRPVVSLGSPVDVPAVSPGASPYVLPAYSIMLLEFESGE